MSNVNWLFNKVMSGHRDDQARRVAMIYGFETQNGRNSELVRHPNYQVEPGPFAEWLAKKHFIIADQLRVHKKWLKESDNGQAFVISFLADGTVVESEAGNQDVRRKGTWTLMGGVLRLHLGDHVSDYVAKSANRLTGAEEHKQEECFYAYFTLKPLGTRPFRM